LKQNCEVKALSDYRYCSECNRKTVSGDSYGRAYCRECGSFYDDSEMNDREKKIAEVLDLSKPVSDCPECGGLGEIRSLGSRRKCECLYIRLKTLKRELDRKDEENRRFREERDKLIECLRFYERLARGREVNDGGRRARTLLAEIGVTVE